MCDKFRGTRTENFPFLRFRVFKLCNKKELLCIKRFLCKWVQEGNVFTRVCDSVHNWPHGCSVTAHPCWLPSHSLLRRGRYASYWNTFLFFLKLFTWLPLITKHLFILNSLIPSSKLVHKQAPKYSNFYFHRSRNWLLFVCRVHSLINVAIWNLNDLGVHTA